jgi:hypothetical protein
MVGREIAGLDWSATSLGSIDDWPVTLQTMLRTILKSRQAISLYWGPDLLQFYNDPYVPMLGHRSGGIGAPFWDFWAEAADGIREYVEQALSGEGCGMENLPLQLTRDGKKQETFFTFSYTPLYAADGSICGFMNIVTETTLVVQAQRDKDNSFKNLLQMFEHSPSFWRASAALNMSTANIPALSVVVM